MQQSVPLPVGAIHNECPFCRTTEWMLTLAFLGIRILPVRREKPRYFRYSALTCKQCGFVRLQHPASFNRRLEPDGDDDLGAFPADGTDE